MSSCAPLPESLDELAQVVAHHLVPILQNALSTCSDRHQLGLDAGADNYSYATDAWSFPRSLMADAVLLDGFPFSREDGPGFGLRLGRFVLRHHRVGNGTSGIESSFPSRGRMLQKDFNSAQLEMFGHAPWPDTAVPVALAYMSSPDQGLLSVHLCTVGQVEGQRIVAWSQVVEVPLQIEEASTVVKPSLAPSPPPELVLVPTIAFHPTNAPPATLKPASGTPGAKNALDGPPPEAISLPDPPFLPPEDDQSTHDKKG